MHGRNIVLFLLGIWYGWLGCVDGRDIDRKENLRLVRDGPVQKTDHPSLRFKRGVGRLGRPRGGRKTPQWYWQFSWTIDTDESNQQVAHRIQLRRGQTPIQGDNRPDSQETGIPSGQMVRLRDGVDYNTGRVEVNIDGRWGIICGQRWTMENTNVICRQLGFANGAQELTKDLDFPNGQWYKKDILMFDVQCDGSESRIQDCRYGRMPVRGRKKCKPRQAIGVACRPNEGCDSGWVSANGLCYKFIQQPATYQGAREKCSQLDAQLVKIESQEENNFISDWLYYNGVFGGWFTAAQKSSDSNGVEWQWMDSYQPTMRFEKWLIGTHNIRRRNCMVLQNKLFEHAREWRDIGYYFWNSAKCSSEFNYICEKVAKSTDCYHDNGVDYRGTVSRTEKGTLCENWNNANSTLYNPIDEPNKGLGDHNFCRNPDDSPRPWCWVNSEELEYGYCALSQCPEQQTEQPSICNTNEYYCEQSEECILKSWRCDGDQDCIFGEDETDCNEPTLTCNRDEYLCELSEQCILTSWRCDGEEDCILGDDETDCSSPLDLFTREEDVALLGYTLETYMDMTEEECAKLCNDMRNYICRSFNYDTTSHTCSLTDKNKLWAVYGLTKSQGQVYYELASQSGDCSSFSDVFECSNGKCINSSKKCDGRDDCNDFSDETECPTQPPPFSVRIVGGRKEHEGRVEVQYLGEWGIVCDDSWDITDAEVVCKQLGYFGALEATDMSTFGTGNGNFLLDEVSCRGDESSLEDCSHNGWREHDCKSYEAAGVVCQVGRKACTPDQFTCATSAMCIPATHVCNGRDDCNDNSDEESCDTIQIELVGGKSSAEGRVEIIRDGLRGTVCDDEWSDENAEVVCKMLGYKSGIAVSSVEASFGTGHGAIWLDDVVCQGSESSIVDCAHSTWGVHDCTHAEDAAVRCMTQPKTTRAPVFTTPSWETIAPDTGNNSDKDHCGNKPLEQPMSRIVGGFNAAYGAYPWQAAIRQRQTRTRFRHFCGATIINEYWLVSAAHCLYNEVKSSFVIRVGDLNNRELDQHEEEFQIDLILNHEQYGESNEHDFDIALIKVKAKNGRGIQFGDYVQPACLPDENTEYTPGKYCSISGWGSIGYSNPEELQAGTIPLIDPDVCKDLYKSDITSRMLCAGFIEGGVDTCSGDSGGPLVCNVDGKYTLFGATSWGLGCAEANAPGVYADVKFFRQWIDSTIKKHT